MRNNNWEWDTTDLRIDRMYKIHEIQYEVTYLGTIGDRIEHINTRST